MSDVYLVTGMRVGPAVSFVAKTRGERWGLCVLCTGCVVYSVCCVQRVLYSSCGVAY